MGPSFYFIFFLKDREREQEFERRLAETNAAVLKAQQEADELIKQREAQFQTQMAEMQKQFEAFKAQEAGTAAATKEKRRQVCKI